MIINMKQLIQKILPVKLKNKLMFWLGTRTHKPLKSYGDIWCMRNE